MMKMTEMEVMLTNTEERGRSYEKRTGICEENDVDCKAVAYEPAV